MISNFRVAGTAFLHKYNPADLYFAVQHFGMPRRLLDWSTNPLAALFFACDGGEAEDGYVYAMNAKNVIPDNVFKFKNSVEGKASCLICVLAGEKAKDGQSDDL